jgi:hypothetical protein
MAKRQKPPAATSDLKQVLALINVGRKALKLKPLKEVPCGIPDDMCMLPIAIAVNGDCELPLDTGCPHCTCVDLYVRRSRHRDAVALAKAWNTSYEDNRRTNGNSSVLLPKVLEQFHFEFAASRHPRLIDRSVASDDEVAELMGCDVFALAGLAQDEEIECAGYGDDGRVYFNRGTLEKTIAKAKVLLAANDDDDSAPAQIGAA